MKEKRMVDISFMIPILIQIAVKPVRIHAGAGLLVPKLLKDIGAATLSAVTGHKGEGSISGAFYMATMTSPSNAC